MNKNKDIDINNWLEYYQPPAVNIWQGRVDSHFPERYHQVVKPVDLLHFDPDDPYNLLQSILDNGDDKYTFVIIGFACDEGVLRNQGRIGARTGPDKLRGLLANLPFNFANNINIYDLGNIFCDPENYEHNLEDAQVALGKLVEMILLSGCHPIILGGGHETAWGHYLGMANTDYAENLGIINFDAHFDLRPLLDNHLGTSGTPFTQIAQARSNDNLSFDYFCIGIQRTANTLSLFEEAESLNVEYIEAENLTPDNLEEFQKFLDFIDDHEALYVSICLDVFASSVAPGVSAPQPLGILPQYVLPFLEALAYSNKVVSLDIVELAPNYDVDNNTARLGAHLIAKYIDKTCAADD
ncbi:MAG: formimidoylglutamase [Gammaproteobacteria bacterium]|nr:formimidoylglutamase [Gammaproteobacteria bacterium]